MSSRSLLDCLSTLNNILKWRKLIGLWIIYQKNSFSVANILSFPESSTTPSIRGNHVSFTELRKLLLVLWSNARFAIALQGFVLHHYVGVEEWSIIKYQILFVWHKLTESCLDFRSSVMSLAKCKLLRKIKKYVYRNCSFTT